MDKFKKIVFMVSFVGVCGLFFNFSAPAANAFTADSIRAQIAELMAQISALQKQLDNVQSGQAVWCHDFNVNLKYGDRGADVQALETALTKQGFSVTEHSSNFPVVFDEKMASSVVGFQEKYKREVLSQWGLAHGTGFVGKSTRAKLNALYGCGAEIPEKSITVLSPNDGEQWVEGNTYNIKWESNGVDKINIEYGNGKSWHIAYNYPAGAGQYSWTIPQGTVESYSGFVTGELSEFNAKIGIWDAEDSSVSDKSDNYFSIVAAEEKILFDSGRGNGQHDKMTYWHYYSEIYFTPYFDMTITSIDPGIYYCNGTCYFNGIIYDEQGNKLAETDNIGTTPSQLNGSLTDKITLTANKKYKIYEHAWTTKSVGIYTAGAESPKIKDYGKYEIIYAKSHYADHTDRGPISFKIKGICQECVETTCTDTDNGKNYYTKGTGQGLYGSNEQKGLIIGENPNKASTRYDASLDYSIYYDHCFDSETSNQLNEAYCNADGVLHAHGYTCPNGCVDGACKGDETPSSITVLSPNGGERFHQGDSYTITWDSSGSIDNVKITICMTQESYDQSSTSETRCDIGVMTDNNGSYSSQFGGAAILGNYTVKVEDTSNSAIYDESDNYFSIVDESQDTTTLRDIENNLASIANAISRVQSRINKLFQR